MNFRFMNTKINFSDMASVVSPNFVKGRVEKSTNLFEARLNFFLKLEWNRYFQGYFGRQDND